MTAVDALTEEVVTAKVAVVDPAATVTLAGTAATALLLLDSVTATPPVEAAPFKITVPVEELLPTTKVGFNVSEYKVAVGVTVSDAA